PHFSGTRRCCPWWGLRKIWPRPATARFPTGPGVGLCNSTRISGGSRLGRAAAPSQQTCRCDGRKAAPTASLPPPALMRSVAAARFLAEATAQPKTSAPDQARRAQLLATGARVLTNILYHRVRGFRLLLLDIRNRLLHFRAPVLRLLQPQIHRFPRF